MVAGILGRWKVWLAVAGVVASLLVAAYFIEGHIAREITGTLVFDCDSNFRNKPAGNTCLEELPSEGYVGLVDVTATHLSTNERDFHDLRKTRTVAEGAVTGTDRMPPVPFTIEFYPKDIDPDGDYVILAWFSYRNIFTEGCCYTGADYRNMADNEHPATPVVTKGHTIKNVVVNLRHLERSVVVSY